MHKALTRPQSDGATPAVTTASAQRPFYKSIGPLPHGIAAVAQRRLIEGQDFIVGIVSEDVARYSEAVGRPDDAFCLLDRAAQLLGDAA